MLMLASRGRLRLKLLGASLLAIGTASPHETQSPGPPAATLTAPQQEIVAALARYATAFASGDLSAIEHAYLADERLSYFEGSNPDWGWESYRQHLGEELPLFSETRYEISAVRPEVSGDMAFATFDWALDVTVLSDQFEDGKHPVSMRGLGTVILVREAGRWKIRHMHTARQATSRERSHQQ